MKRIHCLQLISCVLLLCSCSRSQASMKRGVSAPTVMGSDSLRCGRPANVAWVILPDSVGPISLAATFEDVRRICPGARDSVDLFLHKAAFLLLPGFEGKVWIEPTPAAGYSLASLSGPIWAVVAETPAVRTREGLGVGSTLGDLRERLGPMIAIPEENVGVYVVPRNDPHTSTFFFLDGFDPERVPGGWTRDTAVFSDSIPGKSFVRRLFIRPPRIGR